MIADPDRVSAGRHSRPCCAYCPTCSFFLASTLTTGSPAARYSLAVPLMYRYADVGIAVLMLTSGLCRLEG